MMSTDRVRSLSGQEEDERNAVILWSNAKMSNFRNSF